MKMTKFLVAVCMALAVVKPLTCFHVFDFQCPIYGHQNKLPMGPRKYTSVPSTCSSSYVYRSLDGSCNNLKYPSFGMARSRYTRLIAPKFADGFHSPPISVKGGASLPNARRLSLSVYGNQTISDNLLTVFSMFWGQFIAHDISRLSEEGAPGDCCNSIDNTGRCFPIPLSEHDPIYLGSRKHCLHFARSMSDAAANYPPQGYPYAEKISQCTAFLDLSMIYGNSVEENQMVRQNVGGLLKTMWKNGKEWLPTVDTKKGYAIPDTRDQVTPITALLHTLLVREHNRIAKAIARLNRHYDDERVFQVARKINIAQYQKISYYDWMPLILGVDFMLDTRLIHHMPSAGYCTNCYDENTNAAPISAFSVAALKYGHHQIPGFFILLSQNQSFFQHMRLSDYVNRPEKIQMIEQADNYNSLLWGALKQGQKRPDKNIDNEVRHYFNRKWSERYGTDLKAIDIQRGRDFGLGSYNDFRQLCGLSRANKWSEFTEISPESIEVLQEIYASPDDVDLTVGGSLEAHLRGTSVGPTFRCIIAEQFYRTRTGDRFFFEREDPVTGFNENQLTEIRKASLWGLLCKNTDFKKVQANPLVIHHIKSNPLIDCRRVDEIDLSQWIDLDAPYNLYT